MRMRRQQERRKVIRKVIRKKTRRGVILLVVLGMLAMFALIGVTFVLLSGHARRSATAQAKVGQADNPPDRIADDVIKQILRGSTDQASVIGPHSLLEDLYGLGYLATNGIDDDLDGTIDDADEANLTHGIFHDTPKPTAFVTSDQLIELRLAIPNLSTPADPTDGIVVPDPLTHVGCVLTMINGPAAGCVRRASARSEPFGGCRAPMPRTDAAVMPPATRVGWRTFDPAASIPFTLPAGKDPPGLSLTTTTTTSHRTGARPGSSLPFTGCAPGLRFRGFQQHSKRRPRVV